MEESKKFEVVRLTDGPLHHLFGFHDLLATNAGGDKLLSLEVKDISRPPLPFEKAGVGYVDLGSRKFVRLGETNAYNYPQGARQQWIDDSRFIVNNQVGDHWGADIYDTVQGCVIKTSDYPCHCLSANRKLA